MTRSTSITKVKTSPDMSNDTTFDPSLLTSQLGEYILVPFVGFTLFGILASMGAYIRRQRAYLLGPRRRRVRAYDPRARCSESDGDRDEDEELMEPLWKDEEDFSGSESFG